jgi:hypothetical protein
MDLQDLHMKDSATNASSLQTEAIRRQGMYQNCHVKWRIVEKREISQMTSLLEAHITRTNTHTAPHLNNLNLGYSVCVRRRYSR